MSDISLSAVQIKLDNLLQKLFVPVKEASLGQVFYTTSDLFRKLQSIWPSEEYTSEDVLKICLYRDYGRINSTSDKVFWILMFKEEG